MDGRTICICPGFDWPNGSRGPDNWRGRLGEEEEGEEERRDSRRQRTHFTAA
jgi:hypothetical protein